MCEDCQSCCWWFHCAAHDEECLSIREREKSGDTVRIGVRERENETQVCRPTRDV